MTLLYFNDRFLDHDTGAHPESALRLQPLLARDWNGLGSRCQRPSWEPVDLPRLQRVHDRDYVARVTQVADDGGGRLDPDTVVSPASYEVARLATGAVCDAVLQVGRGNDRQALCVVRPPGHHAVAARAMGFCLFNSIAVAARVALEELQMTRVLIVDWDVHHGNGTQDLFWRDEQVGFLSIHRWPFYPGSGEAHETGSGPGLGTTCNLPISWGTSRVDYLQQLTSALESFAESLQPELILLSAGFDSHRADPIGSLGLETEDFQTLTRLVQQVADQHCGGRLVSVLEGGYHPEVLADCLELHLETLLDRDDRGERTAG